MKNTTITTMAALLLGASGLYAQETTAYTKPSGFVTHTLKAGEFNLLGITLHEAVNAGGSFTAVAGTSLTDTNSDFDAVLTSGETYILEITEAVDTGLVGTIQVITSWTGSVITTPDDLPADGLAVGDKYQIRKAASLTSIFGADNSAGLPSQGSKASSAIVWVQDEAAASGFTKYYYKASVFGQPAGWRKIAENGTDETVVDPATVSIIYTDALYVQTPQGDEDTALVVTGTVKTIPTQIALTDTFNRIAVVYPVGSTLQNSGLQQSLTSTGSAAASDIVFIQQEDGSYKKYYYKASVFGQPAGWKVLSEGGGESDAPAEVALDSGILIQQAGASKNITLTPSYTE